MTYDNVRYTTMTMDTLQRVAPSAFATNAHSKTSDQYEFLATASLIEHLSQKTDWVVSEARQSNVRDPERNGFQKHLITLRRGSDMARFRENKVQSGEILPQILLTNSHDGKCSVMQSPGFLRVVCGNGLVVSDSVLNAVRIRHSLENIQSIDHMVEVTMQIANGLENVLEFVESYKKTILKPEEVLRFANAAVVLRKKFYNSEVLPESLLAVHRSEDTQNSLFNVFNRIQENMIRGYARIPSKNKKGEYTERKARPVTNIDATLRLNKGLWEICDSFISKKPVEEVVEAFSVN